MYVAAVCRQHGFHRTRLILQRSSAKFSRPAESIFDGGMHSPTTMCLAHARFSCVFATGLSLNSCPSPPGAANRQALVRARRATHKVVQNRWQVAPALPRAGAALLSRPFLILCARAMCVCVCVCVRAQCVCVLQKNIFS